MNERVNENIYKGHNNFHTNVCVFTSPGWTSCAHRSLRVHIARMNQVCTQNLACSHRQYEPGVHTKACVFTSPGWTRCSHKSLRVHITAKRYANRERERERERTRKLYFTRIVVYILSNLTNRQTQTRYRKRDRQTDRDSGRHTDRQSLWFSVMIIIFSSYMIVVPAP